MKNSGFNFIVYGLAAVIAVSALFSEASNAASYKISSTEIQRSQNKPVELMQTFDGKIFQPNEFLLGLVGQEYSPTSRDSIKTFVQVLDQNGAKIHEIDLKWKRIETGASSFLNRKNGDTQFLLSAYAGGLVTVEKNGGGISNYEIEAMPDRCAGWGKGDYDYFNQIGLSRLSPDQNQLLVEKRCYSRTYKPISDGWLLNPTTLVFDKQNNLSQSLDRVESAVWLSPEILVSRRTVNGGGFNNPGPDNSFGLYTSSLNSKAYKAFLSPLSGGQGVINNNGYMEMDAPGPQSTLLFPKVIFRVDNFQGHAGANVGVVLVKGNGNYSSTGVLKVLDANGKPLFEGQIPFDTHNSQDFGFDQLKSAQLFGDVLALTAYGRVRGSNGEDKVTNVLWLWHLGDKTVARVDDFATQGQSLLDIHGERVIYIGSDNSWAPIIKIFSPATKLNPELVAIHCPTASTGYREARLTNIRHLTQTGLNSWAFQADCEYSPTCSGSVVDKDMVFQLAQ